MLFGRNDHFSPVGKRGELLRPAAVGLAERAHKHLDHRGGQRERVIGTEARELLHGQVVGEQENGHVPHHLAGGRHLHDVPECHVDIGVGAGQFVPALAQAHGLGLLLEIGVLAAGHLVQVDLGRAAAGSGVEGGVELAHHFPVIGVFVQRVERQARRRAGRGPAPPQSS